MGLGHHIDDLKAKVLRRLPLHDEGAVQVLAALDGQTDAPLLQDGINAGKGGLRRLHAGALADALAHHLTGGTADHQKLAGLEPGLIQKLRHGLTGLRCDLFIHKLNDLSKNAPAQPAP